MINRIKALAALLLMLFLLSSCSVEISDYTPVEEAPLKVTFIDVGQGDSTLVQCGGKTMLIDAGTTEAEPRIMRQLEQNHIKRIDILVGTHPHEDHIGSMDKVIDAYDIGKIYMPKATANTRAFKDVLTAIKNKGLTVTAPEPGTSFKLGDAECTVLAPNSKSYEDLNNYSIVIKLVFGEKSFLFTGDAEGLSEKEMLEENRDLSADVLKVGHHGSSSSTTADFLKAVNPEYAVILCGKGNDYGHPHKETINRLKKAGITVYRTDESGTIVCTSDGSSIEFDAQPGSYKSGGK